MRLSPSTRDIFEKFAEIYTQELRCPTIQEIGSELGIPHAGVRSAMHTLVSRGLLEVIPGARGYRLAGFSDYSDQIRDILSKQYVLLAGQIDNLKPKKGGGK